MRSGSGSSTSRITARTCSRRARMPISEWISSISAIWSPTFITGLSAVIGSWKIIAIFSPRSRLSRRPESFRRSVPSSRISPATGVSSLRGWSPITV